MTKTTTKTIMRLYLAFLMFAASLPASASEPVPPAALPSALPADFAALVPRAFADGLRLVEIRQRCTDCPAWRVVDIVQEDPAVPPKKEKVSVADGITAMYAYPGSGFFANTKIEKSIPGNYERDKAVVTEALERYHASGRQGVKAYLVQHPEQKEKFDRILAGHDYIEFERGRHKGIEYIVFTQPILVASPDAMPAMLHIFVPRQDVIVTAYLMKQKTAMFATTDEFLRSQRAFIEGYIDFVTEKSLAQQ